MKLSVDIGLQKDTRNQNYFTDRYYHDKPHLPWKLLTLLSLARGYCNVEYALAWCVRQTVMNLPLSYYRL